MKDNEAFLRDFHKSKENDHLLAITKWAPGAQVWVRTSELRSHESERHNYADTGDLMIVGPMESKSRNMFFTCQESYKFDTVIIDEVYKFDEKYGNRPCLFYLILNRDSTHLGVVPFYLRRYFQIERRYDPAQKRYCDFYTIKKSLVHFISIEDWKYSTHGDMPLAAHVA